MSRYRSLSIVLIFSGLLTGCGSITGLQDAESNFACSVDMTPRCASLSAVHDSLDKEEYHKEFFVQSQPVTTDGQRIDRLILETPLMTPKRAPEEMSAPGTFIRKFPQ